MEFGFNDEQREIESTAKSFLADRFKPDVVRELAEAGRYEDALWDEICELGWPGIAIAEDHGGGGLGLIELVILCEQLGYACAPTPFLSNACAGIAIETAGSDDQKAKWLEGIASGAAPGTAGEPALVPDADGASVVVVFDASGAVAIDGAGAKLTKLELIDTTRSFARTEGDGEPLPGDAAAARSRIAVAIAAELLGLAQRALDLSLAYAKEREQFNRPIGAYQAVSHRCADMLWAVEETRSLVYYAGWVADAEPESLALAASMAKARATDAAWEVTKSAIQVHGGIGFTWEHDLHFLLKRARASGQMFGSAGEHRDQVAALAGMG